METGTVQIFNEAKGYGYIIADADGKKLFVHQTGIKGHSTILSEAQRVRFERKDGPKGPQAVDVETDE